MSLTQLGTRLTTPVRLLRVILNPLGAWLTRWVNRLLVMLNPFSRRWKRPLPSVFLRYTRDVMKQHDVEIGEYTYGLPEVVSYPGRKLKIGKFCSIAVGVKIILGGNHPIRYVSTYPFGAFLDDWPMAPPLIPAVSEADQWGSKGDVTIGNDVWIGFNAIILSGVTIGDGAVIGAYAVVASNVEPYTIVAGNPARLTRRRFDEETVRRLLELRWWDWPPEKIDAKVNIIFSGNVAKMLEL
jgi:acetyltransferase-like isoleucine patch superfamily enzyme